MTFFTIMSSDVHYCCKMYSVAQLSAVAESIVYGHSNVVVVTWSRTIFTM